MIIGGISGESVPGYDVQDNIEIWNPKTTEGCTIEESIDRKGAAMCGNLLCGGHQGRDKRDSVSEGLLS